MNKKHKGSLARQIFTGCIIFIVSLCLLMGIMSFFLYRESMLDHYRDKINDVIEITLSQIDVPDLEECIETCEASEEFNDLLDFMDQARVAFDLDYIVIVKPVKTENDYDVLMVASGLLKEERYGDVRINDIELPLLGDMIGSSYPPGFVEESYNNMINRYDIEYSTSTTDFGTTFDGGTTIRNEAGEPVALLTAGFTVDNISSIMTHYVTIIAISAAILAAIFLILINMWLRKRVGRPIRIIEEATEEFAKKSHEQKDPSQLVLNLPEIHSNNEFESLAATLKSLSEDMREYVEDIVYSENEIATIRGVAFKDGLTGVSNKAAYNKAIALLNEDISAGEAQFAILMVDINSLKQINDRYGHGKGDEYIINTCKLICDVFDHSQVFRVGGDEFLIIVKGRDFQSLDSLLVKFEDEMKRMNDDPSLEPWERVSAACGVAIYDSALDQDADAVGTRADSNMYERKKVMKSL